MVKFDAIGKHGGGALLYDIVKSGFHKKRWEGFTISAWFVVGFLFFCRVVIRRKGLAWGDVVEIKNGSGCGISRGSL